MKETGEQFKKTATAYYCGNVGAEVLDSAGQPIPCTSKYGTTDCDKAPGPILSCGVKDGSYVATYLVQAIDGFERAVEYDDAAGHSALRCRCRRLRRRVALRLQRHVIRAG